MADRHSKRRGETPSRFSHVRAKPHALWRLVLPAFSLGLSSIAPTPASGQGDRCIMAERFLVEELNMATLIDPDTLDDWRTGKRLPACRITAAGARNSTLAVAARVFYEKLRAADWTRTPDPDDAPNEASLRFRWEDTDCLFNVYQGVLLGTDSEISVTDSAPRRPGQELYHVLVLCIPAMPAKQRLA